MAAVVLRPSTDSETRRKQGFAEPSNREDFNGALEAGLGIGGIPGRLGGEAVVKLRRFVDSLAIGVAARGGELSVGNLSEISRLETVPTRPATYSFRLLP